MNRKQRRGIGKLIGFEIILDTAQKQKDIDADLWVQKNRDVVKTTKIMSEKETIKYFEDGVASIPDFDIVLARAKKEVEDIGGEIRGYQIDRDSKGMDTLRVKLFVDDINKTGRRFI